ncbi:hlyD secretion family protein, partial [Vibrio parahaemolyticus V-223/04]
MWRFLVC